MHSADFLIFRRISVTRQFLVSLTSIVVHILEEVWNKFRLSK